MSPTQVGRCPYCSAPVTIASDVKHPVCGHCGRQFTLEHLTCPNCGTPIPAHADTCEECGEPLTTVGRVFLRHSDARRPPRFLEQVRLQASAIKRSEAESSRLRMESMQEAEARRLEALRTDRSRQAAFDRQLILAGVAVLIGLGFLAGGWALIRWLLP
jgi:ribosomal protein S27AE